MVSNLNQLRASQPRIACPGGGIGRHKGFKIPRRSRCAGSSPARGTIYSLCRAKKYGALAEWLCSGLQIRGPRFDSGTRLHTKESPAELLGFFRLSSVNVKFDFLTGRPRSSSSLYYYLFSKSVFETVPYLAELHIPISFFRTELILGIVRYHSHNHRLHFQG